MIECNLSVFWNATVQINIIILEVLKNECSFSRGTCLPGIFFKGHPSKTYCTFGPPSPET